MRKVIRKVILAGVFLATIAGGQGLAFAQPQIASRYFPETRQSISGRFLEYWTQNGGLLQQGYPISPLLEEQSAIDGKTYDVQYFERAVLEAHPENQRPNDVLLSLLGVMAYRQKYPTGAPNQVPNNDPGTVYFPETDKHVGGSFLAYFNEHGGVRQQGLPISNEFSETSLVDGKTRTVQYFERAVFELHPEFAGTSNEVLLSLLGVFLYNQKYPGGAPGQKPSSAANVRTFTETGHKVGGKFLDYWNTHGALAQQGFPISDEFNEVSDLDGKTYTVQYFERAVFEEHQEFAGTPNEVLLSQLGTFRLRAKQGGPPPAPGAPTPTTRPVAPAPTATPATSDPCAGIPASTNMTVTPKCAPPGTVFSFAATGFNPGELVGVYATRPDQSVNGAPFQVEADSNGGVRGVTLTTSASSQQGIWAMSMEGTQTHVKAIGYFKVVSTTPPPPPGGGTCNTSGSVSGSATPNSGGPGTTIVFRATGFTPGEDVSFWFTDPSGNVGGTPQPVSGGVNSDGSIGPLPLTLDSTFDPGRWALTFEGASSHHQAIIYFCVHQ
jgi:hypothetical protein